MHLCAAKCCEDKNGSIDSVEGCIERCSAPLNRAQKYVQKELGEYQGRLQRCVMVNIHFDIISPPGNRIIAIVLIQNSNAMMR